MKKRRNSRVPVRRKKIGLLLKNNWQLYVLLLPVLLYFFVFNYMPMYGVQIAFKDYKIVHGIWGSEWAGLKHFKNFFDAYYFKRLISNTLLLNLYGLLWSSPIPIVMAILLNRVRSEKLRRFMQTTIYVPYFISTVVLAGMLYIFLSPTNGIFNTLRETLGLKAVDYMASPDAFRTIFIGSGIWQGAGYSSILYIACLSGIDTSLYEAADIDGASVWQKIWYIDVPSLIPTAMMVLILDCGSLLSSSTSKALVLQTPGNVSTSDIIGLYAYKIGLEGSQFSYAAAIDLFVTVINLILILIVNKISKKMANVGLF